MSGIVVDGLRWELRSRGRGRPLLLLHGFTGRAATWRGLAASFAGARRVLVVDLPGHGRTRTADPARCSVERAAEDLAVLLRRVAGGRADVLGYSLGARVALRLAVAHPSAVDRLVLEAPSAGLADPADRAARRIVDERLAATIVADGTAAFVRRWEREPALVPAAPLPRARRRRLRAIRGSNGAAGLAASLRGAGQGAMVPLHERLAAVVAPTLVVAGALDPRLDRARLVAGGIPAARLVVVPGAAHAPHLERPRAFRRAVRDFLAIPAPSEVPAA